MVDKTPACACACEPGSRFVEVNACEFQGQLAWRETYGPTEVDQAIEILGQLLRDIGEIKYYIEAFAWEVSRLLPKEFAQRNKIVYAWTDSRGFNHAVAVQLMNYPEHLPYVTEELEWGGFEKCRVLRGGSDNDGTGDLEIITWRYDEDIPTPWWAMRYRKKPAEAQFDSEKLQAIVRDIQNDGLIDLANPDLVNLLDNYAITSKAKAEYGPEKSDIKIIETR